MQERKHAVTFTPAMSSGIKLFSTPEMSSGIKLFSNHDGPHMLAYVMTTKNTLQADQLNQTLCNITCERHLLLVWSLHTNLIFLQSATMHRYLYKTDCEIGVTDSSR